MFSHGWRTKLLASRLGLVALGHNFTMTLVTQYYLYHQQLGTSLVVVMCFPNKLYQQLGIVTEHLMRFSWWKELSYIGRSRVAMGG